MDFVDAKDYAQRQAVSRSLTYDVVRLLRPGRDGEFDAFPRFYDAQGRADKGDVWASYDCFGRRLDIDEEDGECQMDFAPGEMARQGARPVSAWQALTDHHLALEAEELARYHSTGEWPSIWGRQS